MITKMIKTIAESVPYGIGHYLAKVPFKYRLGRGYQNSSNGIANFSNLTEEDQLKFTISKFNKVFRYAINNYKFYKILYEQAGLLNHQIKSLDDIIKVPIITKSDIRNEVMEFDGSYKINTGGTSGEPFSFFVDKQAFAREWAHMHFIWNLREYNYSDIKLTLRGKNIGDRFYIYNPVHNEFIINTYKGVKDNKGLLINLFNEYNIKYIHGYPSAIYNFLKELEKCLSFDEKKFIVEKIRACFLGSEYPLPYMTKYLKDNWNLDYISWYGHSEMCILAYDANKRNEYYPFYTYGFPEVVEGKLIGTSYLNYDMPLIRYDTGDIVKASYKENGLLDYFKITEGREGDFIIDKNSNKIPLTGLIHGRHHKAFDYFDFIQVKQIERGKAQILCTSYKHKQPDDLEKLFDLSNVDIDFSIKVISEPIRTSMGKLKLKVE